MNSNLREANDFYKKSQESHGVSLPLKRNYLEKAISLYRKELSGVTPANISSLHKNIGLASYRLADILDPDDNLPLIFYYFAGAIEAFSVAWYMKPNERNTEWGGRLEELILDCFEKSFRSRKYTVCYFSKIV